MKYAIFVAVFCQSIKCLPLVVGYTDVNLLVGMAIFHAAIC